MKVLSVIVPIYNTEVYLPRCLDSLLYAEDCRKSLEIILVNDGSKDGSLKVMRSYQKSYPDTVKIIDKENGGHGSTINAGMKIATGKYIRIIDSDDWVNIDNFGNYLKRLATETVDLVLTGYTQDILYNNSEIPSAFFSEEDSTPTPLSEIVKKTPKATFPIKFDMHAITANREVLKSIWQELDEKTFYVDQEFIAQVAIACDTYIQYDMDIYRYFIGRPDQSVGSGFFKHRSDHERVLRWLLNIANLKYEPFRQHMIEEQIKSMVATHYGVYLNESRLTHSEKQEIIRFNRLIKHEKGGIYRNRKADRLIRLKLILLRFKHATILRIIARIPSSIVQRLKRSNNT